MRQHYKVRFKRYRHYIRYFDIGFIVAALVLGSMAIKLAQPDIPLSRVNRIGKGVILQK